MRIQWQFNNTDKVELTLSITMTLSDWKIVAENLPEKYPWWTLSTKIKDAIYKMQKVEIENIYEQE